MSGRSSAALTLLAGLVVAGLLFAVPAVRAAVGDVVSGDLGALRADLAGAGTGAALLLVGLALVHVVVPFPAELPTAAAGFAFGFALGFPLMLAAWVLSGIAAYVLARLAGRPLLVRVVGEGRMSRAEAFVGRVGGLGLLGIRLVPLFPFSIVCFACGVTRVPFGRYLWTTAVGTAPLTALTVLLGARLQEPDLGDPVLWAVVVAMLAIVALVRPVSRRLRAPA